MKLESTFDLGEKVMHQGKKVEVVGISVWKDKKDSSLAYYSFRVQLAEGVQIWVKGADIKKI